ncbi:MAG: cytochrome b N-terminal domain-containing protein, partial [Acidobacteriota bacterium]
KILDWIEARISLEGPRHLLEEKTVPRHRFTFFYFFGGMALFFFIVQVCSGVLLLLYYQPTPANAYSSVKYIMTQVPFGWLIRSVHVWSANLMILCIFLHFFTALLTKAYRKPREMTWMSGFILMLLCLGFGFTGYLLPWNKLSYFATKVGTTMVDRFPFAGHWLLELTRGGTEVGSATLSRFFALHVFVLPFLVILILAFHLYLVQAQGMSVPINARIKGEIKFFPNFLLRDLFAWLVALCVLALAASLFPWDLGVKANPFGSAPPGIKPEWYFLAVFQALKFLPAHIVRIEGEVVGMGLFSLAGAAAFLLPFIDRKASREQPSLWVTVGGTAALVFMIAMTIYGYFA